MWEGCIFILLIVFLFLTIALVPLAITYHNENKVNYHHPSKPKPTLVYQKSNGSNSVFRRIGNYTFVFSVNEKTWLLFYPDGKKTTLYPLNCITSYSVNDAEDTFTLELSDMPWRRIVIPFEEEKRFEVTNVIDSIEKFSWKITPINMSIFQDNMPPYSSEPSTESTNTDTVVTEISRPVPTENSAQMAEATQSTQNYIINVVNTTGKNIYGTERQKIIENAYQIQQKRQVIKAFFCKVQYNEKFSVEVTINTNEIGRVEEAYLHLFEGSTDYSYSSAELILTEEPSGIYSVQLSLKKN